MSTKPGGASSESKATLISRKYAKRSRAGEIWHRLKRNKGAVISMVFIAILLLIMFYSFLFIKYEQVTVTDATQRFNTPSRNHLFGTDDMGRDLFLRTLYGIRYSLAIGAGAVAVALIIGLTIGSTAGYSGGKLDTVLMRLTDILASIPGMLLGMVIVTVLGQSLTNLLIAVSIPAIPMFARIARASVLTVSSNEFVEASRAIGMSKFKIIFSQVVPNGMAPIIVTTTSAIGTTIIVAAGLSFLGFGVPVPTPEWGALVAAGRNNIRAFPHLTFFPGLFIMVTALAINLIGDGLRDALDPKLKR